MYRFYPALIGRFRGYLNQIIQQSCAGETIHYRREPFGAFRMAVECLMLQIALIENKSGRTHELSVL